MSVYSGPEIPNNGLIMMLDAANPKSFSPNTFSKPTDIYSWVNSAVGNNCTLSRDTIASPVGNTPLKMVVTGADPSTSTYNSAAWNVSTVINSQTWTVSVWAKASVSTTCQIFVFGANSSGVGFVNGAWIGIAALTFNITTEWQRIQCPITFNNADVAYIQLRLDGPDASGTGQIIWWDGLQVELASTASTFNSRTNTNQANWLDLTGNGYNATLSNTYFIPSDSGGVLETKGIAGSYVLQSTLNLAASNYTIITATRYAAASPRGRMFNGRNNNWLLGNWNGTTENYYAEGWVSAVNAGTANTNWRILTGTGQIAGDAYSEYVNGTNTVLNSTGGSAGPNGFVVGMVGYDLATELTLGRCSFVLAYNRVLTSNEVSQVYQAYRGRFGI